MTFIDNSRNEKNNFIYSSLLNIYYVCFMPFFDKGKVVNFFIEYF